jgi:RimJ/RimL family protein N-acetyltransferase
MMLMQLFDTTENRAALQKLFEAMPGYYHATTGKAAAPNEAENEFIELPPGVNRSDQFVFGIYHEDELIGCAGVLRGFRTANKAMLGLLLIGEKYQGQGYGARAYAELEKIVLTWSGIDTVRLGVIETNTAAFPFWHKMGFAENGERKPKTPPYIADTIVLEKYLGAAK